MPMQILPDSQCSECARALAVIVEIGYVIGDATGLCSDCLSKALAMTGEYWPAEPKEMAGARLTKKAEEPPPGYAMPPAPIPAVTMRFGHHRFDVPLGAQPTPETQPPEEFTCRLCGFSYRRGTTEAKKDQMREVVRVHNRVCDPRTPVSMRMHFCEACVGGGEMPAAKKHTCEKGDEQL